MPEKFNSQNPSHMAAVAKLPFSYYSCLPHLDFFAYADERNNELLITWRSLEPPAYFPIFLPHNPKNWTGGEFWRLTEQDITKIKNEHIAIVSNEQTAKEYFYDPYKLTNPDVKSSYARRIAQCKKTYEYEIRHQCDPEIIKTFYQEWKKEKTRKLDTDFAEGEDFFFYCLENLNRYAIKQVYVFINNELAGFAWGVWHGASSWVGIHLKVRREYKGLSRFLHQQRATLFPNATLATLGSGGDPGIHTFKQELGPSEVREYYYVKTGGR